jgi:hypothetical protein
MQLVAALYHAHVDGEFAARRAARSANGDGVVNRLPPLNPEETVKDGGNP